MLVKRGEKTALIRRRKTCHFFRIYFWAFPFWENGQGRVMGLSGLVAFFWVRMS
jgi:hypothetical protein